MDEPYFRLVESYRNFEDRICHRTMLNVGFLDNITKSQLTSIQTRLTNLAKGKPDIFEDADLSVNQYVAQFWTQLISGKKIDSSFDNPANANKWVDADTLKHTQVREIGAEWLCFQSLEQLGVKEFLKNLGWDQSRIQLTLTQIISRAVYPASELKTTRLIQENSAVCEITKYPVEQITKDKLYQNALKLYEIKDSLEAHLSRKTNELFDLNDKIVLYDLTNTYFEGEKRNSALAKFGRSKEKRSDAKLVVLALVINEEGFLKYSNIFDGNTSDSTTLPTIIEKLRINTSQSSKRATVVLDAGIATEENLKLITAMGYDYVCVSRSKLKDYQSVEDNIIKTVKTKNGETLELEQVSDGKATDYYLKVKSPGKERKESAMKTQFETRFEAELQNIQQSLGKKHGVKKADKVHQRIGRAKQKYPSASKYYNVVTAENESGMIETIAWTKDDIKINAELGVYFLRTNLQVKDEVILWKIYNTIREIESTFRSLKTDLDLRPIYHKNDDATMAHLHLAILAYWIVNTIRYQLKAKGTKYNWTEIVRIASTQKLVTSQAKNTQGETIEITRCSEPQAAIKEIYTLLDYRSYPFTKRKSVVHKPEIKKHESTHSQIFSSG